MRARVVGDRVVDLVATAPLAAKVRATAHGPELVLVGSAASLLEGDELRVVLDLAAGARLTVITVAAQLAHPCLHGGTSAMAVEATVAEGAALVWRPEPTLVCAHGHHRSTVDVRLDDGARVTWLDEVVFGRTNEDPTLATLVSELRVDHGGRPLLRDGLDTTALGARGPAVLEPAVRYVGSVHRWGERDAAPATPPVLAVDLAGPGSLRRVLAADPAAGRAALLVG